MQTISRRPDVPRQRHRASIAAAFMTSIALLFPSFAYGITDEIQVYTDDINKPGEFGLELHVNTTPSGRSTPAYPGESPPYHGVRLTPEFSYGLNQDFEAGLYLPTVYDADGRYSLVGVKFRLKWMPVKPGDGESGWYFGENFELSDTNKTFSESRYASEVRTIAGYRGDRWLVGVNPILDWDLSAGYRNGGPDLILAWKANHEVASGIALGFEYYNSAGKLNHPLPHDFQDQTLYLVTDFDRKPWVFNFGIGKGLTSAADKWTIKAIFEIPFR
jgi:hypothetical protein